MTERSMLLELKQVGYRTATTKIVNNISFTLQRGEFKLITAFWLRKKYVVENGGLVNKP